MSFPQDVDTRTSQMWSAISQNVDFRKKSVVDLGCRHGEMLWRSLIAGADTVCGLDFELKDYAKNLAVIYDGISVIEANLEEDIAHGTPYWLTERKWDIALCLSILSRFSHPGKALKWAAKNFPVAVIGSGFLSSQRMFSLLRSSGFKIVYQIGKIEGGSPYTIWKCQRVET